MTDEQTTGETPALTPYDDFGGEEFFVRLVAAFYARVAVDPILRPMYPAGDLAPAQRRLQLFLVQYWGGPQTYSEERGHPRLRMRHDDFVIDAVERDRWLSLMHDAMVEQDLSADRSRCSGCISSARPSRCRTSPTTPSAGVAPATTTVPIQE